MPKRNFIQEILEQKGHQIPTNRRWELVESRLESIARIKLAVKLFNALELHSDIQREIDGILEREKSLSSFSISSVLRADWEIARYIPIGLVACIEGYFKQVYADLINHGSPFKENAYRLNRNEMRFDLETIVDLQTHDLSLGDFVAHSLKANSLQEISSIMDCLTGKKFLNGIRDARKDIYSYRQVEFDLGDNGEWGIRTPSHHEIHDRMLQTIQGVFFLRHSLCHEADPIMAPENYDSILDFPEAVIEFLWLSDSFVGSLLDS
jgi:hypothetical protein